MRGVAGRSIKAKRRHFVAVNVVLDNPSSQDSAGTLHVYRVRRPNDTTPSQSLFYERRGELPRSGRRTETIYYYCQEEEPTNHLCVSYEPDPLGDRRSNPCEVVDPAIAPGCSG